MFRVGESTVSLVVVSATQQCSSSFHQLQLLVLKIVEKEVRVSIVGLLNNIASHLTWDIFYHFCFAVPTDSTLTRPLS